VESDIVVGVRRRRFVGEVAGLEVPGGAFGGVEVPGRRRHGGEHLLQEVVVGGGVEVVVNLRVLDLLWRLLLLLLLLLLVIVEVLEGDLRWVQKGVHSLHFSATRLHIFLTNKYI
jgi:hypothetical protein